METPNEIKNDVENKVTDIKTDVTNIENKVSGFKTKLQSLKTFNYNINMTQLILGILILLILGIGGWKLHSNKVNNLESKLATEIKLKNALLDTVGVYQNKHKEWVAEKLTIQGKVKDLEKMNGQLTASQNELIARVKEVNKKNDIITAALYEMRLQIDSLLIAGHVTVDTTHNKVIFADKYVDGKKLMNYSFTIGKVKPVPTTATPTLTINQLQFPNTQFVEFHWKDNKKEGYPIAFSVSNTNDFYKTVSIDSYAIPELIKPVVKPSGWNKIGAFFKKTGGKLTYMGIGVGIGLATYAIFLK